MWMRMAITISKLTSLPMRQPRLQPYFAHPDSQARSQPSAKAYGVIGIKIGNPANTIGSAPLVKFRTLWSASQPSRGEETMITCGLFVRLEAKPGKEQAVADFPAADRP
jgi:hypothetical protein